MKTDQILKGTVHDAANRPVSLSDVMGQLPDGLPVNEDGTPLVMITRLGFDVSEGDLIEVCRVNEVFGRPAFAVPGEKRMRARVTWAGGICTPDNYRRFEAAFISE